MSRKSAWNPLGRGGDGEPSAPRRDLNIVVTRNSHLNPLLKSPPNRKDPDAGFQEISIQLCNLRTIIVPKYAISHFVNEEDESAFSHGHAA